MNDVKMMKYDYNCIVNTVNEELGVKTILNLI